MNPKAFKGKPWEVKSAKVRGKILVIVAEKEIPLDKILDSEVPKTRAKPPAPTEPTEEEEEEEEVSDEEAKQRLRIETEEEEEIVPTEPEEIMERAGKLQDQIEKVELETASPVSKLKGQKGRIMASIDNGNQALAKISEDTDITQGNVSTNLSWLTKSGFVKRLGVGQYEMTAKGKAYLKKQGELQEH